MTIVVEDGSLTEPLANSWVSRADYITYAAARGVTIPDDESADVQLIRACDYINSLEPKLKGDLVERDQPTAYPRKNLELEGWNWSSSEIPRQVISAQLALCLEINAGDDPYNPPDDLPLIEKRIEGALTKKWANPTKVSKVAKTQPSQTIINVLLKNNGLSMVQPVGIRA